MHDHAWGQKGTAGSLIYALYRAHSLDFVQREDPHRILGEHPRYGGATLPPRGPDLEQVDNVWGAKPVHCLTAHGEPGPSISDCALYFPEKIEKEERTAGCCGALF